MTHTWTLVSFHRVPEDVARAVHELHLPEDRQAHILHTELVEVRGPICENCRVHWRDVHGADGSEWPCPGVRPRELGGPLRPPEERPSRAQRRRERRLAGSSRSGNNALAAARGEQVRRKAGR